MTTIQAPLAWANRSLSACEVGGDPFVVAFDAQAQATVTARQAAHLVGFPGLDLHIIPEAPTPTPEPKPKKSAPKAKTED